MTSKLFTRVKRVVYFSLKDRDSAKSLAKHLVKSSNDSVILPFIDYPGPVSSEILSMDFKSLTVCERDSKLRNRFQSYCNSNHPNRNINIYPDDLFDLSFKSHIDQAQNRCSEIVLKSLNTVNLTSGNSKANIKMLVPLLKKRYETGFLRNLYYQMCLRIGLCSNTLIHYYFLMSERQHKYLISKPGQDMRLYKASSILLNTIFRIQTIETYELHKSFGIKLSNIQNTSLRNHDFYKNVYLTLLEPRLEILDSLEPRSFIEYRFLVTQMMQKRRSLVHSFLNNFFDNFSNDLAKLGIYKTTRSGELNEEQFFALFMYLRQRDDYRKSTFLEAVVCSDRNILSL